jgi:precorrin-8X/cobalt-precorrin-8 methylmutase
MSFNPSAIEQESFAIIHQELEKRNLILPDDTKDVIMRCIHTSADFDYASILHCPKEAVDAGRAALLSGADVVTDTNMAKAGISKKTLSKYGGSVHCFMSDPDVAKEAATRHETRAVVCMDRAAALGGHPVIAIGNAPTALMRLCELIDRRKIAPSLVIGVPVGFVNVVRAKEMILERSVPCIVARGNKGGSNIAACIVNALLYGMR